MHRSTQTWNRFVSAEAERLRNEEHKEKAFFRLLYNNSIQYLSKHSRFEIFDCFAKEENSQGSAKDLSIM